MTIIQAPVPEASLSDKICTALVHTVEFLVPPLKKSLQWEPSDFGEILPVRLIAIMSFVDALPTYNRLTLSIVVAY